LSANFYDYLTQATTFTHQTTPELNTTLYSTAAILAAGAIVTALILKK